jgi:hypothetical protein
MRATSEGKRGVELKRDFVEGRPRGARQLDRRAAEQNVLCRREFHVDAVAEVAWLRTERARQKREHAADDEARAKRHQRRLRKTPAEVKARACYERTET